MIATVSGIKRGGVSGDVETLYKRCKTVETILEATKKAILQKSDEVIIKIDYDRENDFELKRLLMIKGFEQ